ncbi:MAG: hypothetical protein AB2L14_35360 [Candidatus Xenobiia bacterium LiM19]
MRDERSKALQKVIPRSPRKVLEGLAETIAQAGQEPGEECTLPFITLSLKSGGLLSGWLLAIAEEKGSQYVTLHSSAFDRHEPSGSLSFVDLTSIESVTVVNSLDFISFFTDGAIAFSPGIDPPSLLELKREVQRFTTTLTSILGTSITAELLQGNAEQDGAMRFHLRQMIRDGGKVMYQLAQDESSRDVIAKEIAKVRFTAGTVMGVTRDGNTLIFSCGTAGVEKKMSISALTEAVEKLF